MKQKILDFLRSNEAKLTKQHKVPVYTLDKELRQAMCPYMEPEFLSALCELEDEGKIEIGETLNYQWIKLK
jgi:hypothetical protein